ncbi:MAG: beta-galactosidase [Elusimicrobiota bacterium]
MTKDAIRYDEKSFFINGKRIMLFGGEFHYFRTPPELWEDRIRKMKLGGCNFVSTYIPWNFHEPEEGKMLWTGDRDLGGFLELCEKYGLYVIMKPGPYICAEWDFGGFPDWLLSKEMEMRTYDEKYLGYIERWFKEIAKAAKKHLITNGGTVILFQIENEYDHYLDMGNFKIPEETAKKYMFRLLELSREAGIDIPTFTNEGRLVRGSDIIETRTFYPNIPWLWLWEFDHFDEKIELTKKQQPGKPTLILELQSGWFDQFGQPLCRIGLNVLDSIMRNVLAHGASLLNLYMYAGGTTFPGWNCRGDEGVLPSPTGNTTSFDFGVSPIREWGEPDAEKYYATRAVSQLVNSFPGLFTGAEQSYDKAGFIEGGESLRLLKSGGAAVDGDFTQKTSKLKILSRSGKDGGLVMTRNLEDRAYNVAVEFNGENGKVRIPKKGTFELPAYTVRLLPVNVKTGAGGWTVKYSTSELLSLENIGGRNYIFLYGDSNSPGETVFVSGKKTKELKYMHSGMKIYDIGGLKVVVLDKELSGRVWEFPRGKGVTTFDYVWNGGASVRPGREHANRLFLEEKPKKIVLDGKPVKFKWDRGNNLCEFKYELKQDERKACAVKWEPDWHYCPDEKEKMPDYDDSGWETLAEPVSLEKAGIFGHGYYWYRAEFNVEKTNGTANMKFDSGKMDRMYVYVNGGFVWKGVGESEKNVARFLKPGRNVVAVRYENAYHTKAHPHEGAIKKYSGLQKPFTLRDAYGNTIKIKKFKYKFNLGGLNLGYHTKGFDDSRWAKAPSGYRFLADESLGNLIWLRRRFKYDKQEGWQAPVKLTIPRAEERCYIYVNGKAVGKYESIGPQNDFYVPETFLEKDNVLAIVVEGPGFHNVLLEGYNPAYLEEPTIEPFYTAKDVEFEIEY